MEKKFVIALLGVIRILLAFFALAICTTATETKSDYDHSYNLRTLQSFKFADQSQRASNDALRGNDLNERRISSAIEENLAALGMKENNVDPSFIVAFYAATQKQAQISTSGYGPLRWGAGNVWVNQSFEGTAIVDFIDAKTKQVVWRGFVSRTVDPNKSDQNIRKDIKKLIERFSKDRQQQPEHASK